MRYNLPLDYRIQYTKALSSNARFRQVEPWNSAVLLRFQETHLVRNLTLPPISALRSIEAVTRLKSVGAAARELNLSHPAISQALTRLERDLGFPLFIDRNNRTTPTEIAYSLSRMYREFSHDYGRLRSQLRSRSRSGVTLGIDPLLAQLWVSRYIPSVAHLVEFEAVTHISGGSPGWDDFDLIFSRLPLGTVVQNPVWSADEQLLVASFGTSRSDEYLLNGSTLYAPAIWYRDFAGHIDNVAGANGWRVAVVDDPLLGIEIARLKSDLIVFDRRLLTMNVGAFRTIPIPPIPITYKYVCHLEDDQNASGDNLRNAADKILEAFATD